MDIDLIESTFNELMGELEKIKDLNDLQKSNLFKTEVVEQCFSDDEFDPFPDDMPIYE